MMPRTVRVLAGFVDSVYIFVLGDWVVWNLACVSTRGKFEKKVKL
jgi:hypothetical protein